MCVYGGCVWGGGGGGGVHLGSTNMVSYNDVEKPCHELSMEIGKGLSSIKLISKPGFVCKDGIHNSTFFDGKVRDEKSPNKGHR